MAVCGSFTAGMTSLLCGLFRPAVGERRLTCARLAVNTRASHRIHPRSGSVRGEGARRGCPSGEQQETDGLKLRLCNF